MPRRQRRQLEQKIRITDEVKETTAITPLPVPVVTEEPLPAPVDMQVETVQPQQQTENKEQQDNVMPRRSRRSPRHLRVSGQRRRRYRDERNLPQSPVPLLLAVASPEMASGKVWVRYPVVPVSTEIPEEISVVEQQNEVLPTIAAETAPAIIVVAESEPTITESPKVAEVSEAYQDEIKPEAAIAEENDVVLQQTESVQQELSVIASVAITPVTPEFEQQPKVVVSEEIAEVVTVEESKDETVKQPVAIVKIHHAYAPMTKASAPEMIEQSIVINEWQRPFSDFEGKGGAGGHSATNAATSPMAKPRYFE